MRFTLSYILYVVVHLVNSATIHKKNETELIQVSVIFRHGARTTDSFYPTDPNKNETFYPFGLGGLTNKGKLDEYKLGLYLKKLYGDFLGEDYTDDEVYVRSTDRIRTKMSAQLVLAGLFPPSKIQLWNKDLLWQPIPVSYKSYAEEDLFHPWFSCPYKISALRHLSEIEEVKEIFIKPYNETFTYVQEHSGKVIRNPADIKSFFNIINTENELGLQVPEWAKKVFPEPIRSIAGQFYGYQNYDPKLKQINSGYMLKKILEDAEAKINGTSNKKIFLYSGHESTVGYMLNVLNVYKPQVPAYGSAISFEVHRGDDQYYVKLRFKNETEATEPIDLIIPGCEVLCPFDRFLDLNRDVIPTISVQEICKKK